MKLIPKVETLAELRSKAYTNPQYAKLLCVAASNLGGGPAVRTNLVAAYQWLCQNAAEAGESGVVDEVNYCRDLI